MKHARLVVVLLVAFVLLTAPGLASAHPAEQGGRPTLPDKRSLGTEHFVIHYTITGDNSVPIVDADASGVPDYVEAVADAMENNWAVQIGQMGWPIPPGDAGEEGDERLDVYLEEVLADGEAGYVETNGFVGDNPNTPALERRAAYGYMVLDDDYEELDPASGESPDSLMRATTAHEFNHLLQAGLDNQDIHAWYYEATSSWMEEEIHDDVNDVVYYLDSVMKNPDICPVAYEARGDSTHWYGMWIFNRLLSERYGPEIVRDIWLAMPELSGYRAMDDVLQRQGTTLEAVFLDMAVANLLRAYEEGATFPTVRVEGEAASGLYSPPDGVQSFGADYVALTVREAVTVSVLATGAPLSLTAVGLRGAEADVFVADGGEITLDPAGYDEMYLLVFNPERAVVEEECRFIDYTISVLPASAGPAAPQTTVEAPSYVSPLAAAVTLTDGGASSYRPPDEPFIEDRDEYAITPEGLDVPFQVLVPASLPEGYFFDYAYILTQEDLGADAPFYAPGGGDMANFDYLDGADNWLSIGESAIEPGTTLEQWLEDIDYDSPGEIVEVAGNLVLVENLGDEDDPWYSATLILNGLFIVVDGDHSVDDTLALVAGLIEAAADALAPTGVPPGQVPPAPTGPVPVFPELGSVALAGLGLLCAGALCVGAVALAVVVLLFVRRRR